MRYEEYIKNTIDEYVAKSKIEGDAFPDMGNIHGSGRDFFEQRTWHL